MNEMNRRFANFRECCDHAPKGTYEWSKEIREIIGRHVDAIAAEVRATGITPCMCDGAHNVEAAIYAWITKSPDCPMQIYAAEGFGQAMDSNERDRVIAQAERDRCALEEHLTRGDQS